MTFGPRKTMALVVVVVAFGVLVAVLTQLGRDATLLALGALQLLTIVGVAAAFVEVDRRRRRSDHRRDRDLAGAIDALRGHLGEALLEHRRQLREELREDQPSPPDLRETTRHTSAEVERLRDSLHRVEERLVRREGTQFAQLEALLGLYAVIEPTRPLPASRGWAASPDLLATCWTLAVQRPGLILECGSGVSTVVLAYACQRNGRGRVVALEHDEGFAVRTRQVLADHGLDGWAEVRVAPLETVDDAGRTWYRPAELPEGPIDLVLVDGPPGGERPDARAPAMDLLYERLSPACVVVVDDCIREQEDAMVHRWVETYPEFELEELRHEKGTAILRRQVDGSR